MPNSTDSRGNGPAPRPNAYPVPIPHDVQRCPACRTPFAVGRLGRGTAIEVQCRRHGCVHHTLERPFTIIVM